jgi:hypothetical protein
MAVVVNDLMLEPKAMPPAEAEAKASGGGSQGTAPPPPDLERQVRQIEWRSRERGLRLWAH